MTAPAAPCNRILAAALSTRPPHSRTKIASPATLTENVAAAASFNPGEITNPAATTIGIATTINTSRRSHLLSPLLSAKRSVAAAIIAVANPAK